MFVIEAVVEAEARVEADGDRLAECKLDSCTQAATVRINLVINPFLPPQPQCSIVIFWSHQVLSELV